MDESQKLPLKCFFAAWIFAWVTAIYFPSALIALADLSPATLERSLLLRTFAVADEVAPAAKIGFAILLGGLAMLSRRLLPMSRAQVVVDMVSAALATLLILAALPLDWSRGFGIGLTGNRFTPAPTAIYLGGALLSGLVFWLSAANCALRARRAGTD